MHKFDCKRQNTTPYNATYKHIIQADLHPGILFVFIFTGNS